MLDISVVMVTNRDGAVEFLKEQLDKQTKQEFEVIIADDGDNEQLYDKQFVPRQPEEGDAWNLNRSYNDCLDKVEGELIVFVQDFIKLPANGLERFWEMYEIYPNALVTGCGHKYKNGKITEVDERVFNKQSVSEANWTFYELNWASCPTEIATSFEEDMDEFYGCENQIFALKSEIKHNANILVDHLNECRGLSQEECGGRPDDWERRHHNKKGRLDKKVKEVVAMLQ